MFYSLTKVFLLLIVSILAFIGAGFCVFVESPMDSIYVGIALLCGLISLAMYRKRKPDVAIHFST